MSFTPAHQVKVSLAFAKDPFPVGRLALRNGQIYFEYDSAFLERGLEISPLKCPLRPGLQTFDPILFEGLPGVFNDSLPDGWGRLLLERKLLQEGLMPGQFGPLDQLTHVGHTGMGALLYAPDYSKAGSADILNLDQLANHTQQVLDGATTEVLQELLTLNGSAAGTRPKAMIGVDRQRQKIIHGTHHLHEGFEHWLVKFPNRGDSLDAGAIEYVYALMASDAGLDMEETHLFPADKMPGYFATRRFDRDRNTRLHMHSASGLLHSDFRRSALDYKHLIMLTMMLTKDIREAEKMFRLATFNVLSHNRDDHGKNFSFLMDPSGQWRLSPAYDLTFSSGPGGEQSTMVMAEGKHPSTAHLVKLGLEAKLPRTTIEATIEQTKTALSTWRRRATEQGVHKSNIQQIEQKIEAIQ